MKTKRIIAMAVTALSASLCLGAGIQAPASAAPKYKLLWSQEFNNKKVSRLDPKVWDYDLTDGYGWGNGEEQYYTNYTSNVKINGKGQLEITANRLSDTNPILDRCFTCTYTSARIKTANLLGFRYGKMSAHIKMPSGTGTWPAFWMLGDTIINGGTWPEGGEIDIIEARGAAPNVVHGTVHGPGYFGGNGRGASYYMPTPLSAKYHEYSIEWLPNKIVFSIDNTPYYTLTPESTKPNRYVYNQEFFLILNLAMGGTFGGETDASVKSATMKINWIRYYSINGQGKVFKKG
jgi:beta-glucanase (GH16 family)